MTNVQELKESDLLVLCSILHLGDNAYGVTIKKQIEEIAGRVVSTASIYLSLSRLDSNNLVNTTIGDATPERGGRRKTYYRLTAKGERQVKIAINSWIAMIVPIAKKWELL